MMSQSPPPHAILATVGTDGDIYPFLALGQVLRARGYRVTLATHEHFARKAAAADLEFCALVSHAENEVLLENPDLWHPVKSPVVIARWGVQFLERQYHQLRKLAQEPHSFLVAGIGVIAARLVQEKHAVSLASVALQPWVIASNTAPPVMMTGLGLPAWAPQPIKNLYWRGVDQIGLWLMGNELNSLRVSLDLPPVSRVFRWWNSPQLVIGFFPEWYGPPQGDWIPQLRLAGFPGGHSHSTSALAEEITQLCDAGPPPVAFTFGTGMRHAHELFRQAVAACQSLGVRGIFITQSPDQLPHPLPPYILLCAFAPFRNLFPRCAAVVHHGGIGTTADALASGIPQLILPFAFDQLDNAQRVQKLGVGNFLKASRRTPARIAGLLGRLLAPEIQARAKALADNSFNQDGLEKAAEMLAILQR